MHTRRRVILGSLATSAITAAGLGLAAGPASASETTACPDNTRLSYARVELFVNENCGGGRMVVKATDTSPDRPDFRSFVNFDGKRYNVDNTRSSVRIAPGTCIRLYDGVNYTGLASTNICAGAKVLEWNLARFDDRATSMKVFAAGGAPAPNPTPNPQPTPNPTPTPAPGANTPGVKAAAWAEKQVGIRECSATQRAWAKTYGLPCSESWCGIFVFNAFKRTGTPLTGGWASTEWIYDTARAGKKNLKVIPTPQVQRGDIVLMYRPLKDASRAVGHVGIALGPVTNGSIRTAEGNYSNKVVIRNESTSLTVKGGPKGNIVHKRVVLIARLVK